MTDTNEERFARIRNDLGLIDDPEILARLAAVALAHIDETRDVATLRAVLTELTHTARAVSDTAQRAAGVNDVKVSVAMWRLTAEIGTRLTDEPLAVLHGEPEPEPGGI